MDNSQTALSSQVSDLASRVADLESPAPRAQAVPAKSGGFVLFDAPIMLATGSTSSTAWVDAGAARHLEGKNARLAWVFAAIEDTIGGTGRTTMYGRAGGKQVALVAISESGSSSETAAGAQAFVPVVDGRFDFRLDIASGASSAGYRLELLGYFE